jgi:hypothetical protein
MLLHEFESGLDHLLRPPGQSLAEIAIAMAAIGLTESVRFGFPQSNMHG